MDPSSAPWRAFEAPTPDGPGTEPAAPVRRGGTSGSTAGTAPPIPRLILLGALAAILLLAAGAVVLAAGGHDASGVVVGAGASPGVVDRTNGGDLVVDVAGAVVRPGVYHLRPGSRVGDAIAAAGGFGPRVDAARAAAELNLAAQLEDGQHLQVPSRDGPPATTPGSGGGAGQGGGISGSLVDLNGATEAELEALPGIGPATAAKIIAAREASPFVAVQDLRNRKLVGQKTFDGLKDLVTVR